MHLTEWADMEATRQNADIFALFGFIDETALSRCLEEFQRQRFRRDNILLIVNAIGGEGHSLEPWVQQVKERYHIRDGFEGPQLRLLISPELGESAAQLVVAATQILVPPHVEPQDIGPIRNSSGRVSTPDPLLLELADALWQDYCDACEESGTATLLATYVSNTYEPSDSKMSCVAPVSVH
jgi:hypothetical protein